MDSILTFLFIISLALLLVHEMDAVRNREWRMFIVLKDMEDEKACRIFLLAHVPLYAATLLLLMSPAKLIFFLCSGCMANPARCYSLLLSAS